MESQLRSSGAFDDGAPIKKKGQEKVYFHRELLAFSEEERCVELLTITGPQGKSEDLEERIPGLFPDVPDKMTSRYSSTRPHKFNKPTIFFSCRVHCGEVPGQHVMNGILKFLVEPRNVQAQEL